MDSEKMKLIVLMSAYNGEKYIVDQLDSILAQIATFQIQICVRDDGSNDKTQDILRKYASKGLIRWYTGENLGPSLSFLDLIKRNPGYDFYAFSDQDDFWSPNKLENAVIKLKQLDHHLPVLYCSNAQIVDQNLNSMGRLVYKHQPVTDFYTLSCAGGILGCTMVFNDYLANLVRKPVALKKENIYLHDFFVLLLCASVNGKIIYDAIPQLKYRQHLGNVVGVPTSLFGTIKNRLHEIKKTTKVSISQQSKTILDFYYEQLPENHIKWLKKVSKYKTNILNTLCLSFSLKTKYASVNMGIKNRLLILMRKR